MPLPSITVDVELEIIEVPIHAGVIERLRAAVGEFWAMVASGEVPELACPLKSGPP